MMITTEVAFVAKHSINLNPGNADGEECVKALTSVK